MISPMATLTTRESEQIRGQANEVGPTPVVFVHGLWLLPSSWDRWATLFEEAGYAALRPAGPTTPRRSQEAKAHPEVFAGKTVGQVADHFETVIGGLDTQAGDHRSLVRRPARPRSSPGAASPAASVAIDPAPFRGVLPLPISALQVGVARCWATRRTATGRCR